MSAVEGSSSSYDYEELYEPPLNETSSWKVFGSIELAIAILTSAAFAGGICASKKKRTVQVIDAAGMNPQSNDEPDPIVVAPDLSAYLPAERRKTFDKLRCPEHHQALIKEVVEALANKSGGWIPDYVTKAIRLKYTIKPEIDYVHPFKFLWTIFRDPELRQLMRSLGSLPKDGFMEGVNEGMKREINALEPYIREFTEELNKTLPENGQADPRKIKRLIQEGAPTKNWIGLVDYLISLDDGRAE